MYLPGDFAGGISTLYLVRSLNIFLGFSTQSFRMRTIHTTENSNMRNLAVKFLTPNYSGIYLCSQMNIQVFCISFNEIRFGSIFS